MHVYISWWLGSVRRAGSEMPVDKSRNDRISLIKAEGRSARLGSVGVRNGVFYAPVRCTGGNEPNPSLPSPVNLPQLQGQGEDVSPEN
jgi:hypothetical protein